MTKTALITGATSGLGLAVVRQLIRDTDSRLILPVRDLTRGQQLLNSVGRDGAQRISLLEMDLANLSSVREAAKSLTCPIDIVLCNAGVQSSGHILFTNEDLEQSFAVNQLAHFVMLRHLEHLITPAAMLGWIGSGTHHPELAKTFGFTGAHYIDMALLAKGEFGNGNNTRQSSRDAYATSKGLNILTARHFARLNTTRRYFSFDPGLMPGTGLAREAGPLLRVAWHYVLPVAALFMRRTSTPARSAAMLVQILMQTKKITSGEYVEFTGRVLEPHLPTQETLYSQVLFDYCDQFI